MNLFRRNFLTLKDYTREEIEYLLDLAMKLKVDKKKGITGDRLKGKNIALLFEKPSTRTRCAFVVGARDEGGFPEYLGKDDIQLGHKESVADTARVLGRMFDGIEFRGFKHSTVEELAKYAGVPVWNGLTDEYHPSDELVNLCKGYANESGAKLNISDDLDAVKGADVIYTDVWASMGEEDKAKERIELLRPYQVNKALMDKTGKDSTIFMHCLPAVKGYEVTEDVFESDKSVVFDEAENRMHTIKAVMVATLGREDDK